MTAPVALFAYARPEHLEKTLASLRANRRAQETPLIVFCDGARSSADAQSVERVRQIAGSATGFKSLDVRVRAHNVGLATSIIEGVSQVCEAFGRVIVLEDDMIVSPTFLDFMNDALDTYAVQPKVWHITGWNYPIDIEGLQESFLWRGMNCWGWATWADRWVNFHKDPEQLISSWTLRQIDRFNIDRAEPDFWGQVEANARGDLNTWAIFWYATIFRQNGLCLNPSKSLVLNIGLDGSGEHCGPDVSTLQSRDLKPSRHHRFPTDLAENTVALARIKTVFGQQRHISFNKKIRRRLKLVLKYGMRR
ncbi:MAG: sugar transferase [Pseudomonadota bacterium]